MTIYKHKFILMNAVQEDIIPKGNIWFLTEMWDLHEEGVVDVIETDCAYYISVTPEYQDVIGDLIAFYDL